MEWQEHTVPARARVPQRLKRPVNLVTAGQKHQHISFGLRREPLKGLRHKLPYRPFTGRFFQIAHLDWIRPAGGNQERARVKVLLKRGRLKGRGHDNEKQVRPQRLLNFQRPRKRDVPVQMALVKLVETNPSRPRSSSICGICVDLPEPVGASSTTRGQRASACTSAPSNSKMGRSGRFNGVFFFAGSGVLLSGVDSAQMIGCDLGPDSVHPRVGGKLDGPCRVQARKYFDVPAEVPVNRAPVVKALRAGGCGGE